MTDLPEPALVLPNFRPLRMELSNDCGPVAMLQALDCALGPGAPGRRELIDLWRFREGADRLDTPGAHMRVLRRLGVGFAARRGLEPGRIRASLGEGLPVVLLAPAGFCRWHWIVVAGWRGGYAIVSAGGGELSCVNWAGLAREFHADRLGRALGVRAFGYCVMPAGKPPPFPHDHKAERDALRLAALSESGLAVVEPLFKWGWRRGTRRGIFRLIERGA